MSLEVVVRFHGAAHFLIKKESMYQAVRMNVMMNVLYLIVLLAFIGLPQLGHARSLTTLPRHMNTLPKHMNR